MSIRQILLTVFFLLVFLPVSISEPYAKTQYCSDEAAILFALKIKQAVKGRNLRKLSDLFSDESEYVPPVDYLKGKNFSDVFSDKWRAKLLSSETVCNWSKGPNVGAGQYGHFEEDRQLRGDAVLDVGAGDNHGVESGKWGCEMRHGKGD